MSNSLLEHLSAINDLVEDVLAENRSLRQELESRGNTNRKKLTKREAHRIRQLSRGGYSQREIADIYDINPGTVSRIVRGQYHK